MRYVQYIVFKRKMVAKVAACFGSNASFVKGIPKCIETSTLKHINRLFYLTL